MLINRMSDCCYATAVTANQTGTRETRVTTLITSSSVVEIGDTTGGRGETGLPVSSTLKGSKISGSVTASCVGCKNKKISTLGLVDKSV